MSESYMKEAYAPIYQHPKWKEEAKKYEDNLADRLIEDSYTKKAARTALTKSSRILQGYSKAQDKKMKKDAEEISALAVRILGSEGEEVWEEDLSEEEQAEELIQEDYENAEALAEQETDTLPGAHILQEDNALLEDASYRLYQDEQFADDMMEEEERREGIDAFDEKAGKHRRKRFVNWIRRKKHNAEKGFRRIERKLGISSGNKVTREGMLLQTGINGTAYRALGAYRRLGASKKELLDFRLALIAWLIYTHANSLYDILQDSHDAGVKGSEELEEAALMYTNIDPLDIETLREEFAPQKEFPHEVIYKKMLNELYQIRLEKARESYELLLEKPEELLEEDEKERLQKFPQQDQNEAMLDKLYLLLELLTEKTAGLEHLKEQYNKRQLDLQKQQDDALRAEIETEVEKLSTEITLRADDLEKIKNAYMETRSKCAVHDSNLTYFTLYHRSGLKISGTDAEAMRAQDLALNIYTTEAFGAMNHGQREDEQAAKEQLKGREAYNGASKEEQQDEELLEKIHQLLQMSARMSQDAIEERGNRRSSKYEASEDHGYEGWAYRGGFGNEKYYNANGYVTENLTSTSKDLEKAFKFYVDQVIKFGHKTAVLAVFHLHSRRSIELTNLSTYDSEEEVLVAKGTRFKVKKELTRRIKINDPEPLTLNEMEGLCKDTAAYQTDEAVTEEEVEDEQIYYDYRKFQHLNIVQLEEDTDAPIAPRFQKKIRR